MHKAVIWEPAVRIFHWLLAILIIANLIIGGDEAGLYTVHVYIGYIALLLVSFRIAWGFIGSKHARFWDFLVGPGRALRYGRELATGDVAPHRGHTPLGGYMIVALLLVVAAQAVTGILTAQGSHAAEDIHEILPNVLWALIALHLGGVLLHSWRARENIVRPMITGRKDLPAGESAAPLVPARRSALTAAVVLGAGLIVAQQIDLPALASDAGEGGGESGEGGESGGEGGEGGEEGGESGESGD